MGRLKTRTARLRDLEELLLLKPEGMGAAALAESLHVDRRTIYRDLDFLAEQGVPLWQEAGVFGVNRTYYHTTVRLTYNESIALVLAGLLLSRTFDERNPHVIAALRRLAVTLPEPLTAQLERAAARTLSREDNPRHTAVLEAIAEGWGTGHQVRIAYLSPKLNTLQERVIDPYMLEPTEAGIYVIGHDAASGAMRTFKLERLQSASVMPETYQIPQEFDPASYLKHSWKIMTGDEPVEVLLHFNPAAVAYIRERTWHHSQELRPSPDGGLDLSIRVADPREMLPWIRSWGAQVEVKAPDWLREQVAEEFLNAAELYR
jgi:proteasome accessory factor B